MEIKKLVMSSLIAISTTLILSSCAKDLDCVCTYTEANGDKTTAETVTIKGTKKKAAEACESKNSEWSDVNGSCQIQ